MKHIILVNPVAGRKKGEKYAIRIQKLLKKHNIESSIHISKYSKHLTIIAKRFAKAEKCRFYSVGGDGSLNEIMHGVLGTDSEIVVIPSGTGNDFARTISKYKSMRKIINISVNTPATLVDVIKLNNNKYCLNILSAGFDAMVGKNINKFRWVPLVSGTIKYNLSIIYTLFQNRNFRFKIRLNDEVIKKNFTLVAISNGKFYGGGVSPSPNAKIDDGLLDICLINSTSLLTKIILLPKYKAAKHQDIKLVKMIKTNRVSIVSNKQFPINIDGEIFNTKKLKCEIVPNCLNIVKIET